MRDTYKTLGVIAGFALAAVVATASPASSQIIQRTGVPDVLANRKPAPPPDPLPPDYIIGVDDTLIINVFGDTKASGEVMVRPDGKIALPQFGDEIVVSGLRPEELKDKLTKFFVKYYEEPIPTVSVGVKDIQSRRVYIDGAVAKPGPYRLSGPMTVSALVAVAGGLLEFANKKDIVIQSATLKDKNGQPQIFHVNYVDLMKGKNPGKNSIELRPGDMVFVR